MKKRRPWETPELMPCERFFKQLPQGATFYLDHCPGNAYRALANNKAEFIRHRLGSRFVGCVIDMSPSQVVSLEEHDPADLDLL